MSDLRANVEALLALDADGALVPHGIGGHARTLLEAQADRIAKLEAALAAARELLVSIETIYPEDPGYPVLQKIDEALGRGE